MTHFSAENDEAQANTQKGRRIAMIAGGGAVLLAAAGGLIALILANKPDPAKLQQAAQMNAAKYECARVVAQADDKGNISLQGHVRDKEDIKKLESETKAIQGVGAVSMQVTEVIYPHCAVAIMLDKLLVETQERAPKLALATPGTTAAVGALFKLNLTNAARDGYVYVDFYDRLGNVFHLIPGPATLNNLVAANTTVMIGDEKPGGRIYKVAEPLGQQVVTAVVAKAPLFTAARPERESAADYLKALEQPLKAPATDLGVTLFTFDIVK